MCLGVPGRVERFLAEPEGVAEVDVAGVTRMVDVSLVRERGVEVGDWVLIHVGFALSVIDEDEAREALQALQRLGDQYEQELREIASSEIT